MSPKKTPILFYSVHLGIPFFTMILFSLASIMQVYFFQVNDFDFGNYLNLVWNIANGLGWDTSLYKDLFGFSFLGDHLVFGAVFLAPFMRLWESPYTLAVIHGVSTSVPFFILPYLVKEILQSKFNIQEYLLPALMISMALFANKTFLAPWRSQTHMGTLFAPFLLVGVLALHQKSWKWLAVSCILLLLAQERSSVSVFGLGIYALVLTPHTRLGFVLCGISTVYFFVAVKIVIPWFQGSGQKYIYSHMVNPFFDIRPKLKYIFTLFMSAAWLPLIGRRALLASCAILPMLGLNIISDRTSMYSTYFHYTDTISLMLSVASIYGLGTLLVWSQKHTIAPKKVYACCCILLAILAITDKKHSPIRRIHKMLTDPNRHEYVALRREITPIHPIPKDIDVFTQLGLGPQLALHPKRRLITPERGKENLSKAIVVLSPIVDQWGTDFEVIQQAVQSNTSLVQVFSSPRVFIYVTKDIEEHTTNQIKRK